MTKILLVAGVYFCAGKLGLSWAHIHISVSAVWPPSGLALAALLLWGCRLWPGIFVGAFVLNATTQGTVVTALGIATGNTLEALFAAWAVNTFANGAKAFERARNTFRFVVLAPLLSPVVSATLGTLSLTVSGFARPEQFGAIWLTWWLGDAVGELIFAPFIIIWLTQPLPRAKPKRVIEASSLLIFLSAVGHFVFMRADSSSPEYLVMLPLLWAAFRFGQRGAVTSALIMSVIALAGTLYGVGPYAEADPNESLLHLQSFMSTLEIAALVLASVLCEAKRAEQRLEVQESISRVLAESPAVKEAAPLIIEVLCRRAGWDIGAVWIMDRSASELQYVDVWHVPGLEAPEFERVTIHGRIKRGTGLPGRVLSSGKAIWISDVTMDAEFRRAPLAEKEGLHGAFAFPIKLGQETLGVVECFSREVREIDDHFLEMVSDIGAQLGQFIHRKRAEDDVRAQRLQLRAITDVTPLLLTQCTRDFTYEFVNRAYAALLGTTPEEIIGKSIWDVIGAEGLETIRPYIESTLSGRTVEYEAEIRFARIGPRFLRVVDTPVTDDQGQVRGWIASMSDITERKRTEDEIAALNHQLAQREEHLRAVIETAVDGIITIDEDETITTVNPATERIFGYFAAEMVGQNLRKLIPTSSASEADSLVAKDLSGRKKNFLGMAGEVEAKRKDGTPFPLDLAVSETRIGDRRIFIAILRDISDRKRASDLLRQARDELVKANQDLEKRVRERTADLEQANAALLRTIAGQKRLEDQLRQAQKMESIGTLAGGIAHDFNNILNIIRGYATLIGQQPLTAEQLEESLRVIDKEIDRGASVVRQLLTIARKSDTHLAPTNISDIVLTLNDLIKTFPKNISVSLNLDTRLMPVLVDRNQMSQVLLNICLNARDAMPAGGKLTIQTEKIDALEMRERHDVDAASGAYVCVTIGDTGTGITEEVRARMFEPFYTTKGISEGTGLGLAIVYGIVKDHNGFIEAESEPGKGTTFRVYLPVLESAEMPVTKEHEKQRAVSAKLDHRRGTILVVEDEEPLVRLLNKVLPREGYQVLAATNGEQGIDLYQVHKSEIDIVLLDLGLPKMTGMDVIPKLREQNPDVNIVIATGYLEPEVKAELLRAGVRDCINKPYLLNEVLEKLDAVLESPRNLASVREPRDCPS
ncbi:MAG TPA: MASE1 domain-containing protein [Candidatus Binatia bacterium]|nr:MASE1 domain-containing protein [Candidatus Binatia bacterium]